MCIWVAKHNLEKPFQLFLFLKLLYREGKTKMSPIELQAIAQLMGFADTRPVKKHLKKLEELEWIRKNERTGFYIFVGFDKLRLKHDWESRASVYVRLKEINNLFAFIGAAIFTYQHKDFWRKVKRERSVRIKGRTYHSLSPSFNFKRHHAPIATTGIKALHGISTSKVSEMKIEAHKLGYISVRKDFEELPYTRDEINVMIKHADLPRHIRKINQKFFLQLIDLVLPNIDVKRRHKLGR